MTEPSTTSQVEYAETPDGFRVAYRRVGSGPLLICQPGGPGRASEYLEDLGGLSSSRTLVLADTLGTGASDRAGSTPRLGHSRLTYPKLADDLVTVLTALGVGEDEPVDLLGHSAGAVVAQVFAARHAGRLRRLVLVTPMGLLQGTAGADIESIRASRSDEPWYPAAAEAAPKLARGGEAAAGLWPLFRPFYYGRWDERTKAHAAGADTQMDSIAEDAWGGAPPDPSVRRALAGLGVPALVIGGALDGATGLEPVHAVAADLPSAHAEVIAGAGHFPWIDEPARFRELVETFLR
ncbi:MAG: alpha/beta hydrolase [Actinomycetota bacterium]|nr:alpha/beta hydrolase [Actinomycetota bacterium]